MSIFSHPLQFTSFKDLFDFLTDDLQESPASAAYMLAQVHEFETADFDEMKITRTSVLGRYEITFR